MCSPFLCRIVDHFEWPEHSGGDRWTARVDDCCGKTHRRRQTSGPDLVSVIWAGAAQRKDQVWRPSQGKPSNIFCVRRGGDLRPPGKRTDACRRSSGERANAAQKGMAGRDATLPEALDLNNLVSLPPEKQSLTLLQWLVGCESFLATATPEHVSQQQQPLLQALVNLLSLPTPPIAHVLRSALGRCFHLIFDKGDHRVLFDTVATLIQKVALVRADKETKQKQ